MIKCAKSWESKTIFSKRWKSVLNVEQVCKKLSWESLQNVEKVKEKNPKCCN